MNPYKCGSDMSNNIWDSYNRKNYKIGAVLGKGAFGKCFEITDTSKGIVYAGKIISKTITTSHNMKHKIVQEISIHKTLNHQHIVGFFGFFDDANCIYILLELCRNRSMMELHKKRKILTNPEVRYYANQVLSALKYLHENNIIHRDLKLANLFISNNMHVKVGDFGLATKIDHVGERKLTLCGTPNYIAPEILEKKGHGFEVDVWSFGCILYTLLVGKPPFEGISVKDTYTRVRKCNYCIPSTMHIHAARICRRIFIREPRNRPNVCELIKNAFFTDGYVPEELSVSCLVMAPHFEKYDQQSMHILESKRIPFTQMSTQVYSTIPCPESYKQVQCDSDTFLQNIKMKLIQILQNKPLPIHVLRNEIEDPALQPIVWVSSWIDYSDKYGFGYKLSDNSVGVIFIDSTKLVLLSDYINMHYIDCHGSETYFTVDSYEPSLTKKTILLQYFRRYMANLSHAGTTRQLIKSNCCGRVPVLMDWMRYDKTVVMLLSNGTFQINFLQDHSKIIICPLIDAISYIDKDNLFHTFKMDLLEELGCPQNLNTRLHYCVRRIKEMITYKRKLTQ